jgi:hypothetical protein
LATGESSVNQATTIIYDKAWEFNESRKATMETALTGIDRSQFMDRLDEYTKDYLEDATI